MVGKAVRSSKVEPLLILVIVIAVGIILAIFWSSHRSTSLPVVDNSVDREEATLSIDGIRMTAMRGGQTAWLLTAKHGLYFDHNSKAIFTGISATFLTDGGSQVHLTADRATYFSSSNDLEVSGHVVIENDQYQLITKQLAYDHEHRVLTSHTRVRVKGNGAELAADGMAYDLRTRIISLKGNIAGVLSDHLVL